MNISRKDIIEIIEEELLSEKLSDLDLFAVSDYASSRGFDMFRDDEEEIDFEKYDFKIPKGLTIAFPVVDLGGQGKKARLSSKAGPRRRPKPGASNNHAGRDYAIPVGTPIVSYADGEIVAAGNDKRGGKFISIKHPMSLSSKEGSGSLETQYLHLSKFIKSSGKVKAGEVIALSGNTGISTGPHLHFTIKIAGKKIADDSVYAKALSSARVINPEKSNLDSEEEIDSEEGITESKRVITRKALREIIERSFTRET